MLVRVLLYLPFTLVPLPFYKKDNRKSAVTSRVRFIAQFFRILDEAHLSTKMRAWPEVIKLFSCSTQMSMLINVEMPTTVGISTFMSRKIAF